MLQYSGVVMSFDVNGVVFFRFSFVDVGQIIFFVNFIIVSGDVFGGKIGFFVIKFVGFVFDNIVIVVGVVNFGVFDDIGCLFVCVGVVFGVCIMVVIVGGVVIFSFGKEILVEGVLLMLVLVQFVGGIMGGFDSVSVLGSQFSVGVVIVVNFVYDEVGVICFKGIIVDVDYLGGGDVSGVFSMIIGCFVLVGFVVMFLVLVY